MTDGMQRRLSAGAGTWRVLKGRCEGLPSGLPSATNLGLGVLLGASLLIASLDAGAVAPSASNRAATEPLPLPSARTAAPKATPAKAPVKAAPTKTATVKPKETKVASLDEKSGVTPPKPRIKPGPLTDKPKVKSSPPKAAPSKTAAKKQPSKEEVVFGADPKVPLSKVAAETARKHGVDPHLVNAVILAESLYNPKALSHKGAMGLMQLIPGTAARYGVKDAWNPNQNIDGGVRYLRDLLGMFDNDIELTLAAYNAGEKAVMRYGRNIPPYQETQTYVARATAYMARLQNGTPISKLRSTGVGISGGGLSGWGVIFGSFHNTADARRVIKEQRRSLSGVISGGRSAVVSRKHEANRPYAALIVALDQDRAVKACRHIGQQGGYCRSIPPEQLRDPKALWR